MRGEETPGADIGCPQHGVDHRRGGTFALAAGDMDDLVGQLIMPCMVEQRPGPFKAKAGGIIAGERVADEAPVETGAIPNGPEGVFVR